MVKTRGSLETFRKPRTRFLVGSMAVRSLLFIALSSSTFCVARESCSRRFATSCCCCCMSSPVFVLLGDMNLFVGALLLCFCALLFLRFGVLIATAPRETVAVTWCFAGSAKGAS